MRRSCNPVWYGTAALAVFLLLIFLVMPLVGSPERLSGWLSPATGDSVYEWLLQYGVSGLLQPLLLLCLGLILTALLLEIRWAPHAQWRSAAMVGYLLAFFAVGTLMLSYHNSYNRELARRISCTSNLKIIGLHLYSYAADHDGWLPPDLTGMDYPEYLRCPSCQESAGSDYRYYGSGQKIADFEHAVIAEDGPRNHPGKFRNQLWGPGYTMPAPHP